MQSLEGDQVDPEGPALQDDPDEGCPYAVLAVLVRMLSSGTEVRLALYSTGGL